MASWAKPGARCVCVDKSFYGHGHKNDADKLVVGGIYTIDFVFTDKRGVICVRLQGVTNESAGYMVSRFRPLITKTQEHDVALFKHHLIENSAHIDA